MEEKKAYSKVPVPDYRMMRPKAYLPSGSRTVYQSHQNSQFMLTEDCGISFLTPNGVGLFVNKARKEYDISLRIYHAVVYNKLKPNFLYVVQQDTLSELYDYFESIQSCVIMVYSAIEALCNVAIPDEYTLTKKNNKGITEVWNKANIEKWTSTEEKAGKIVPELLGIKSPKSEPFWEDFKKLKFLRDEIIHQKQSTLTPNEVQSTFLELLLNKTIFDKVKAGFSIVQYFCDKDRTHNFFPMLEAETPVNVNFVDDVGQIPGLSQDGKTPAQSDLKTLK